MRIIRIIKNIIENSAEIKDKSVNNNKINNDIIKYIINKNNNYDNYDNVEIRIKNGK